jgi:hypothetical protein
MSHDPGPRPGPGPGFAFAYEVGPSAPADAFPAETPITATKAALEGALARWSTELVARYGLDHPDAATPAQALQEVRVAGEIRQIFWSLTPVEKTDPDALARARAQAAALISRELALDPPISLRGSPEERALRPEPRS